MTQSLSTGGSSWDETNVNCVWEALVSMVLHLSAPTCSLHGTECAVCHCGIRTVTLGYLWVERLADLFAGLASYARFRDQSLIAELVGSWLWTE